MTARAGHFFSRQALFPIPVPAVPLPLPLPLARRRHGRVQTAVAADESPSAVAEEAGCARAALAFAGAGEPPDDLHPGAQAVLAEAAHVCEADMRTLVGRASAGSGVEEAGAGAGAGPSAPGAPGKGPARTKRLRTEAQAVALSRRSPLYNNTTLESPSGLVLARVDRRKCVVGAL